MSDDKIELEGVVTLAHPGCKFTVEAKVGGSTGNIKKFICTLGGKLRQNNIRILVGDKVTISVSTYDLERGIIVWRTK